MLETRYHIDYTIRWDFYRIELKKEYKGLPWFHPEKYEMIIWTVTVKFREDKPYFQTSSSGHNILEEDDIKQILELIQRWYVKEDFHKEIDSEWNEID